MATQKPKIQGYIEQATFDCFEAYRQKNNLSQSQGIERILGSFFGRGQELEHSDRFEEALQPIRRELTKLLERVARLEITSNLDSESLEITNNLDSESLEITNNLDSESLEITNNLDSESLEITNNLDSESLEITNNLDSESLEITNNLDSESLEITGNLDSESLEITGNLDSESLEITGNLDSNLDSDSLEITRNLDSNLTITENGVGLLPKNLTQVLGESSIELNKFIVCAINKETNLFYFWNGSQKGFSNSMLNAKRYKSEGMAERARLGILKDDYFSDYYSGNFELRYNTVRYFKENPAPKSKERVSV